MNFFALSLLSLENERKNILTSLKEKTDSIVKTINEDSNPEIREMLVTELTVIQDLIPIYE